MALGPAVTRGRGQLEGAAHTATVKAEWAKLLGRGDRGVKRTEPDRRQRRKSEFQKTSGSLVRVVIDTGTHGGGSQRGQEDSEQEGVQIDDEGTETAGGRGLAPPPPA